MESDSISLTPYENFLFALKAKESKRQYPNRLDKFLTYMEFQGNIEEKCEKLYDFSKNNFDILQSHLVRFINSQKERIDKREISEGTLHNYIKAVKLFLTMNDIVINWKKLAKGIPQEKQSAEDRIPTMDEIHKLVEHPDRRIKIIVYVMISSGIRVGSWDHLHWKHVIPIKKNNTLIAAKLIARNTKINNREYYTFITPEAYNALKDYMDFRQLHGEKISPESFLIRDTWQKIDRKHGHRIGLAKYPKKMNSVSIRNMVYEAWHVQGVRDKLHGKEKRHEFKSTHGFRKVFETRCQNAKMNHNNIKLLMDHSLGESQNYHRPLQDELVQDYLHAVDFLTINDENKLKKKILELTERQDEIDLLKLKHEREMQAMDNKLDNIISIIQVNPKLAKIKSEVLKKKIN